jgi:hypothetical protein
LSVECHSSALKLKIMEMLVFKIEDYVVWRFSNRDATNQGSNPESHKNGDVWMMGPRVWGRGLKAWVKA